MAIYANIVSTVAALAAGGSLYLHWVRWRHDQRNKTLIVRAEIEEDEEAEYHGWNRLCITLRSRSNIGYQARTARVIWPPSGRIVGFSDAMKETGDFNEPQFHKPEKATRVAALDLMVAHSGQVSKFGGGGYRVAYGERESDTVFIRRNGRGRMLLAINIEPEDDSERPLTSRKWVRV